MQNFLTPWKKAFTSLQSATLNIAQAAADNTFQCMRRVHALLQHRWTPCKFQSQLLLSVPQV